MFNQISSSWRVPHWVFKTFPWYPTLNGEYCWYLLDLQLTARGRISWRKILAQVVVPTKCDFTKMSSLGSSQQTLLHDVTKHKFWSSFKSEFSSDPAPWLINIHLFEYFITFITITHLLHLHQPSLLLQIFFTQFYIFDFINFSLHWWQLLSKFNFVLNNNNCNKNEW